MNKMARTFNKGRNMASGLALWSRLLHLLVLVMCVQGTGGRKMSETQDGDGHETTHTEHARAHHPSSHIHHHMDPSFMIFFTLEDLKEGKTMAIYFPKRNPSKSPHLLPREEADQIPFSSKHLLHLLHFFSFSQDSPQAKAMEDTLRQCEIEPIKGEIKSCSTSLESMLDFTRGVFRLDTPFSVVATTHLTNSTTNFQNYTILEEPKEILAPKMVACHTMPYPYAVFYCHSQKSVNKVFKVLLGGEDGDRVEAVAVCHLDTSQWSPNHASSVCLGLSQGLLLCVISFLLIILCGFQHPLQCSNFNAGPV